MNKYEELLGIKLRNKMHAVDDFFLMKQKMTADQFIYKNIYLPTMILYKF